MSTTSRRFEPDRPAVVVSAGGVDGDHDPVDPHLLLLRHRRPSGVGGWRWVTRYGPSLIVVVSVTLLVSPGHLRLQRQLQPLRMDHLDEALLGRSGPGHGDRRRGSAGCRAVRELTGKTVPVTVISDRAGLVMNWTPRSRWGPGRQGRLDRDDVQRHGGTSPRPRPVLGRHHPGQRWRRDRPPRCSGSKFVDLFPPANPLGPTGCGPIRVIGGQPGDGGDKHPSSSNWCRCCPRSNREAQPDARRHRQGFNGRATSSTQSLGTLTPRSPR